MEPLGNVQRKSLAALLQYPLMEGGRAYLEARGLADVASELKLGQVSDHPKPEHRKYARRIVVPSFSARGTVVDMALRCTDHEDCGSVELWRDKEGKPRYCRKWEFLPGISKRLYGLDDIRAAGSVIHIAEGHPDRMTLKACGLHAVGVAGVQAWKPDIHRRLFQGFETVYYWQQSDDNGQSAQLGEKIRMGLSSSTVILEVPVKHDVNSYYQQVGREGVLALLEEGEDQDERDDEPEDDGHYDEDGIRIPF